MQGMQDGVARVPVETHPALDGLVGLRSGGVYGVDSASLALALLAGPSRAGAWAAVVGAPDFGVEAAAAVGVELSRTILVPEPGDQWLSVTAALVDIAQVVILRVPERVSERDAERLSARLRTRSAVLIAWGPWPRCEVRLEVREQQWSGLGRGHGHLRARRLGIDVRRGSAPPVRADLWFPSLDTALAQVDVTGQADSDEGRRAWAG